MLYSRDGNRRSGIPDGSPIPSCSLAENNGVCSYRKDSLSPYNCRSVFFAAVRQCGQEWRHQQEPDALDGTVQKLLFIETKNKKKWMFWFQVPAFQ